MFFLEEEENDMKDVDQLGTQKCVLIYLFINFCVPCTIQSIRRAALLESERDIPACCCRGETHSATARTCVFKEVCFYCSEILCTVNPSRERHRRLSPRAAAVFGCFVSVAPFGPLLLEERGVGGGLVVVVAVFTCVYNW